MQKLKQKALDIVEHAEPNLPIVGLFATVGYPLFYLVWTYITPQAYENLPFRIAEAVISLPWLFYAHLPKKAKEFFPVYFFLSVPILLPFFFHFMMIKNEWSVTWAMSSMAGLFLLILIVYDWLFICIITLIGFIMAYAAVYLLDGVVKYTYFQPEYIPTYLFALVGGIIGNHRKQMAHQTKISLLQSLSGSIAHEMRNPLSSITNAMSSLQAILPSRPLNNEVTGTVDLSYSELISMHDAIEESSQTIRSGNKIIDSILASLQGGAIDNSRFKRISANNAIQSAVNTYGFDDINDRELIVVNTSNSFDFLGDRNLFTYVLFNLIKNALHYKNRPEFRIEMTLQAGADVNCITVKDYGPGVPSRMRERIFERFYTYGKNSGNGLGLSFCRRVIESFGGTIVCNSEEGNWTEFVINLPDYASKASRDLKKAILKQKKILIVDDQISNRLLLARYASEWDCSSDLAENGTQALEMLSKTRYDLILMDFEMPSLDGDQLVAMLRSSLNIDPSLAPHYMQVPVIGITALPLNEALPRAARCGMNEVIAKPIKKADINKLFERHFFSEASSITTDQETLLSGCRILLVDDNATSRKYMSMTLQHYGCSISEAENGKIALEYLEKQDYDLILLDMEMPVMTGIETSMAIRKGNCFKRFTNYRTIPIIALTGNTGKDSIEAVIKAGMNQHLGKPVFRDELVSTISMWINNISRAEENGKLTKKTPVTPENFWETFESEKVLDQSIITSLKEIGNDELIVSLFEVFRNDSEKIIRELDQAAAAGNIKRFDQLMHTLKGSSGSIGANRLFMLSRHLNDFSHRGEWPDRQDWAPILKKTFLLSIEEMENMQKTLKL